MTKSKPSQLDERIKAKYASNPYYVVGRIVAMREMMLPCEVRSGELSRVGRGAGAVPRYVMARPTHIVEGWMAERHDELVRQWMSLGQDDTRPPRWTTIVAMGYLDQRPLLGEEY